MTDTTESEFFTIQTGLAQRVQDELGQNVYLCYQCVKCTSGCPLSDFFDWQPNQIMRAIQFGQEDIALESKTPWLCASCQTCTTRCPQGLDIAAIMEFLARHATASGYKPQVPAAAHFNKAFMREVKLWGRAYELGLMAELKLRTGNFTEDLDLGAKMFAKNKFAFLPSPSRPSKKVHPVTPSANTVAYYPGCSLHSTAQEFNTSTLAVSRALGLELVEPKGWLCCGSSAAHRQDPAEAVRLPVENLALIEQYGLDEVTMPCAACFNRHKVAQHEVRKHPKLRAETAAKTTHQYQDTVAVKTLIDTLLEKVGLENIAAQVIKPLKGLRVVCYYGCLLTRPPEITQDEHPENPTQMDQIVSALGAEALDWSYKTSCCGASHSLTSPEIVLTLSKKLIDHARHAGAEMIAVACPLCHTNLDARQFQMGIDQPMPILYFTQLLALALDLPAKDAALHKNLVDPKPLLREKDLMD